MNNIINNFVNTLKIEDINSLSLYKDEFDLKFLTNNEQQILMKKGKLGLIKIFLSCHLNYIEIIN